MHVEVVVIFFTVVSIFQFLCVLVVFIFGRPWPPIAIAIGAGATARQCDPCHIKFNVHISANSNEFYMKITP